MASERKCHALALETGSFLFYLLKLMCVPIKDFLDAHSQDSGIKSKNSRFSHVVFELYAELLSNNCQPGKEKKPGNKFSGDGFSFFMAIRMFRVFRFPGNFTTVCRY